MIGIVSTEFAETTKNHNAFFQPRVITGYATLVASFVKGLFLYLLDVEKDTLRESICSEIAWLLKKERLRKKLSLNLISSKAGLSRQTVSFIEHEERTPTVDTLLRLTAILEIKLEDLIRRARKRALARKHSRSSKS